MDLELEAAELNGAFRQAFACRFVGAQVNYTVFDVLLLLSELEYYRENPLESVGFGFVKK